jgi:hypothetical protein
MRAEYEEDPGYCTIGGYLGILFLEAAMKGASGGSSAVTAGS